MNSPRQALKAANREMEAARGKSDALQLEVDQGSATLQEVQRQSDLTVGKLRAANEMLSAQLDSKSEELRHLTKKFEKIDRTSPNTFQTHPPCMLTRRFCFCLRGTFERSPSGSSSASLQRHLRMCFRSASRHWRRL